MRYLGIDWGEKRIGLAFADELGVATPLAAAVEAKKKARLARIAEVVKARQVDALVVGYPLNMDGSAGFKAREVDTFIGELERRFRLPVYRVDERLSSRTVEAAFRGRRGPTRRSGAVDSSAAALILRDFLQNEVGQAEPPPE